MPSRGLRCPPVAKPRIPPNTRADHEPGPLAVHHQVQVAALLLNQLTRQLVDPRDCRNTNHYLCRLQLTPYAAVIGPTPNMIALYRYPIDTPVIQTAREIIRLLDLNLKLI